MITKRERGTWTLPENYKKKAMEHESDIVKWFARNSPQSLGRVAGILRNWRTFRDRLKYNIIIIGKDKLETWRDLLSLSERPSALAEAKTSQGIIIPCQGIEKTVEHENDLYTNYNWGFGTVTERLLKGL